MQHPHPQRARHEQRHRAPQCQEEGQAPMASRTSWAQTTNNWNEHATKPSFAHAQSKIEQPPCQPESYTQPTQNKMIRTRQAWAVFQQKWGDTGKTKRCDQTLLTTKPNASLSHAVNTTPKCHGRKASTCAVVRASGPDEVNFPR